MMHVKGNFSDCVLCEERLDKAILAFTGLFQSVQSICESPCTQCIKQKKLFEIQMTNNSPIPTVLSDEDGIKK